MLSCAKSALGSREPIRDLTPGRSDVSRAPKSRPGGVWGEGKGQTG